MLGNKLGFAIEDWDEDKVEPQLMSIRNLQNPNDIGSVLVPRQKLTVF